jgi:hypothetical protein
MTNSPNDSALIEAAICLTDSALAIRQRVKELIARKELPEAEVQMKRLNALIAVNTLLIDMATKLQTEGPTRLQQEKEGLVQ